MFGVGGLGLRVWGSRLEVWGLGLKGRVALPLVIPNVPSRKIGKDVARPGVVFPECAIRTSPAISRFPTRPIGPSLF